MMSTARHSRVLVLVRALVRVRMHIPPRSPTRTMDRPDCSDRTLVSDSLICIAKQQCSSQSIFPFRVPSHLERSTALCSEGNHHNK